MSRLSNVNRRTFLGAATAAAFVAPLALGANEAIQVGCIGTGGRCRQLLKALKGIAGVRVTALCDIDESALNQTRPLADSKAFTTKRHKELLDRKDVHAVLIASPDHWHVPMAVDACAAGKDVYVEKPLTHGRAEEAAILTAQNRNHRVVQVGMQQRSMPHIAKAKEIIDARRLGKVHKVHLSWNRNSDRVRKRPLGVDPAKVDWKAFLGNAPAQPFDEYKLRNWRWFWDFGGGIFTDLMVHWIDVAHWLLDLDHPLTAASIGSFVTAKGIWQTPDTVQTIMVYPGDIQVHFEGTFFNARNASMIEFMGTDATLYIDRGRYEIHPERDKGKVEEFVLGSGARGRDFYDKPDGERLHLENWLACVRNRKRPNAPVEAGVRAAAAAHLANQSLRSGQVAAWKS
ncbi:MAG: Gfo/Idh/MocA family protein [Candidatus Acidiferrum sp.]